MCLQWLHEPCRMLIIGGDVEEMGLGVMDLSGLWRGGVEGGGGLGVILLAVERGI